MLARRLLVRGDIDGLDLVVDDDHAGALATHVAQGRSQILLNAHGLARGSWGIFIRGDVKAEHVIKRSAASFD